MFFDEDDNNIENFFQYSITNELFVSIFVLFIFTLILISFASLFIMNECTRELLNSTGISADYYVEFNEPVEFSEMYQRLPSTIKKLLEMGLCTTWSEFWLLCG